MNAALEAISVVASQLAANFPKELVVQLASAVAKLDRNDWAYSKAKVLSAAAHPAFRLRVSQLLDVWETTASEIVPQSVSLALLTAAQVEADHRQQQNVELVWTGPDSQIIPLRRTDQALLQLIRESTTTLTVVSFAVYKAEKIARALVEAGQRGVQVTVCLETADASEGKIAYDTIKAIGAEVAQRAKFYIWPLEQRLQSHTGKHGTLHAKVAVADRNAMLVSSANLTEYAMTLNMELGLLLRGGPLPGQVHDHFLSLIEQDVLTQFKLSETDA